MLYRFCIYHKIPPQSGVILNLTHGFCPGIVSTYARLGLGMQVGMLGMQVGMRTGACKAC
jgi:hypothetical protein